MHMSTYRLTVGLEIHVELATKSKMFCGCPNNPHSSEPNTNICPVCLAHPGTLPVPNEEAIAAVLMFGEAIGATKANYSEFDRKHYFYPDIPKAYQLSQYAYPFLTGGEIQGVQLTRVHLEEDTARSQHDKGEYSLVDFNRAGVPLMELVTEPVIHTPEDAANFARELQLILRTLGIAEANMEKGELRVEANISVSNSDALGTKVEVKNLNSFKSVELAIAYERERHISALEAGEVLVQETRGWDEVKLRTFSQRAKETAKDYRYFPDPDIPKIAVSEHEYFSRLSDKTSLLPQEKREKYSYLGIPKKQIETIISDKALDLFFAEVVKSGGGVPEVCVVAANYLTSDVVALFDGGLVLPLEVGNFVGLMKMVQEGKITSRVAKDLLPEVLESGKDPVMLATERNLLRSSDEDTLRRIVTEVITEHATVADEYQAGKVASLQFLLGQAMKKTRGSADPVVLRALFEEVLR